MKEADQVLSVKCTPGSKAWDDFLKVPYLLYDAEHITLSGAENIPLKNLHCAYVTYLNNEPQARLALYEPHFAPRGHAWCFGAFECVDDIALCRHLFDEAGKYVTAQNIPELIGPMNGSTWENYRLTVAWDQPPFFSETWHPPYYPALLASAGFVVLANYSSDLQTDLSYDHEKMQGLRQRIQQHGVHIRNINIAHFGSEIDKLYPFATAAFEGSYLYSAIDAASFKDKYLSQQKWLDPAFVFIAENEENQTVGFIFGFPDYLDKTGRQLVVKTVARNPHKKYNGLAQVLCANIADAAIARGYTKIVHAFMHEDNSSVNLSGTFAGKKLRSYCLYHKLL